MAVCRAAAAVALRRELLSGTVVNRDPAAFQRQTRASQTYLRAKEQELRLLSRDGEKKTAEENRGGRSGRR